MVQSRLRLCAIIDEPGICCQAVSDELPWPVISWKIIYKNDRSRDRIMGSVANEKGGMTEIRYSRGSVRGHKDTLKQGIVVPKAALEIVSSICSRVRCKFPMIVSTLCRKKRCSLPSYRLDVPLVRVETYPVHLLGKKERRHVKK